MTGSPTEHLREALEALADGVATRAEQDLPLLDTDGRERLLAAHHPDSSKAANTPIRFGSNAGEPAPRELAALLAAPSHLQPQPGVPIQIDDEVDVLVIGGGGAGTVAALSAHAQGASVLLATKLRLGDSNTCMANGISAAIGQHDSPSLHFLDTLAAGRFTGIPALVRALVEDGPSAVEWLRRLGVALTWGDHEPPKDGGRVGGHSVVRGVRGLLGDTGLEMIRVLREEIADRKIPVVEFHPVVDCLLDQQGRCAGAVLSNVDTGHLRVVAAKATILATGGLGRLHCGGFPTSNHHGATGDGLVVGYRAGAKLVHTDALQYHPTGLIWPDALAGLLLSEHFRLLGGHLVNRHGQRFINEMDVRDVVSAAILRECAEGRGIETPSGARGVWLDVPELIRRVGRTSPATDSARQRLLRSGLDIYEEPCLVYPTLHYQNGGLLIDEHGQTSVPGLYAAGEVAGGVHGRNRLGGNAMLDVLVFGRRAGAHAAAHAAALSSPRGGLDHIIEHNRRASAELAPSPQLFPLYSASADRPDIARTQTARGMD